MAREKSPMSEKLEMRVEDKKWSRNEPDLMKRA